ncbi:MAG: CHAT domain-containing protein [Nitrospirota bacterium]
MGLDFAYTKLDRVKHLFHKATFYKQPLLIILFLCLIGHLILFCPYSLAESVSAPENSSPEKYMVQGMGSFQKGAFEQAVIYFQEASRLYEKEGKHSKQSEVLSLLYQAHQSIGQYNEALKNLKLALTLAEKSGDKMRIASVFSDLGNLYIATGPSDKAYQYLNEGLVIARGLGNANLSATILNNLGNLFTTQKKYSEAIDAYTQGVILAEKSGNHSLVVRTLANAAMAYMQSGQYQESKAMLERALDQIRELDHSHDKAYGLINIGLAYHQLCHHLPEYSNTLLLLSSQAFNEASTVAEAIGDFRALSYAFGYLGKLSENEHQHKKALELTRRAVFSAQQVNAPESLYLWQWQTGRLLKVLWKIDDAILAYRHAINTLQSLRHEMSICYGSVRSTFRESMEPVYFEFVDLLLQRAASMQNREEYEPYLIEAREAIELLKVVELRDYFQDDCIDATRSRITKLDIVSKTAIVIYPIVFPDRTELLVSFPTGLKRFSVRVSADTLTQEIKNFRQKLEKRTTREYLPLAQKLYDLLIRPFEPDLKSLSTDTLVFVPDGPLRTIPMAALHDGNQFLIDKYAIAITPGLNLSDPRPITRDSVRVLIAGLTDSVQGFPPIPSVKIEVQSIHDLYGGKILFNQNFLSSSLENELKDEQFTIVHIASHGQFTSDVKKTFLLTFDDRLTIDQLDQYVGLFKFREDPLELLLISA